MPNVFEANVASSCSGGGDCERYGSWRYVIRLKQNMAKTKTLFFFVEIDAENEGRFIGIYVIASNGEIMAESIKSFCQKQESHQHSEQKQESKTCFTNQINN